MYEKKIASIAQAENILTIKHLFVNLGSNINHFPPEFTPLSEKKYMFYRSACEKRKKRMLRFEILVLMLIVITENCMEFYNQYSLASHA